jgi:glutamyl-tRNA synthetase/glutamyl-Q tRNA(Asp) synthetase
MRTRFAPSPTGHLHLGHVVNAIYVWGLARASGGRVLLRMEDHDRIRCRPEYEASILEDLEWLGFEPDEGRHPLLRQSDRQAVYEEALERLRAAHHLYACECSRKQITGERYVGVCRDRGLAAESGRGLRVQIDEGVETFDDLFLGTIEHEPAVQCGDLLLRDRDDNWTYQFAVTVDDIAQQITDIIRGEDLASSTGRQLRLRRMLGNIERPRFAHHPLILKSNGEKLSKGAADTGIRELRRAGLSPSEVIGRAAAALGLVERIKPIAANDVAGLFNRIPTPGSRIPGVQMPSTDVPRGGRIHHGSSL